MNQSAKNNLRQATGERKAPNSVTILLNFTLDDKKEA
jgi:hypothetical protein